MAEFPPPGETAEDLFIERTNLDGVVFSAVAFGGLFTLAFECMQFIGTKQRRSHFEWILFGYSFLLVALGTIAFGGSMKFNDMTFIDYRNYPGGPNGFARAFYSHWINLMSFICYILMSWVSDAFMLYRGYVLWHSRLWVMILPTLVYLGSIGISVPVINSVRNDTFWNGDSTKFTTVYWSLSTAFNILSTVLIVAGMLIRRNQSSAVPATSGSRRPLSNPVGVKTTLIESASLSSIWGISFIVSYAIKSPFQSIPQRSLGHIQGISSLLIIFRMLRGKSWPRTGTVVPSKTESSSVAFRGQSINHHTVNLTESFPLGNIERKAVRDSMRSGTMRHGHDSYSQDVGSDSSTSKAEMFDSKVGHAI